MEDVVKSLEKGEAVGLTLCDLSRAFDCISHDLLVQKLFRYGIRGNSLQLFHSYLSNRKQCVVLNQDISELTCMSRGVPQGSILGPLLFIIYINDLFNNVLPYNCICYADDTSLSYSDKDYTSLCAKKYDLVFKASTWFTQNYLKLNCDKTQEIIISTRNYMTSGSSAKILGITIDDSLSWGPHITEIKRKLSSSIFVIAKLRDIINQSSLLSVYYALFHSHLSYAVHLWGNSSNASEVFTLQKKIVRIIVRANYTDHCKPFFIQLKILTLPSLYIFYQLLEIYKNKKHFVLNEDIHTYSTRSSKLIRKPNNRLCKSDKNSLNVNLFNILPDIIKHLHFNLFKKSLKAFLVKHAFYSVDEFVLVIKTKSDVTFYN